MCLKLFSDFYMFIIRLKLIIYSNLMYICRFYNLLNIFIKFIIDIMYMYILKG